MPGSPEVLGGDELRARLAELPGWEGDPAGLTRRLEAPDFPTAVRIVDEIALVAEEMDHHPDIDIRWRTLVLALSTHSAGGVTDLDLRLAARISQIADENSAT